MASEDVMPGSIDVFLYDELLENVFFYLSPIELIIVERVSKRWKEISLKSWRNKTELSFYHDLGHEFPVENLVEILRRGGKYLRHLDMFFSKNYPVKTHYPDAEIFKTLSMYCHRLQYLHLDFGEDGICPNGKYLHLLESSVLQDLRGLEIACSRRKLKKPIDERIISLLQKTKKLKEIEISAFDSTNGTCFLSLPITCEKLSILSETLDEEIFIKALENLPNLKSLNIDGTERIEPKAISKICHKLEALCVGYNENVFFDNKYKLLSLENIKIFHISQSWFVNDDVLLILVDKMPLLEEFRMIRAENVTPKGFRSLEKLKYLKSLDISSNHIITDETLTQLAKSLDKLEKVSCEGCKSLTCSGLINLIGSCKKLHVLKTAHFEFTDDFFKTALKLVDKRPINSSLTIDIAFAKLKNFEILVPCNDRQLKYNYCKVMGWKRSTGKWGPTVQIIRYVSGSSISEKS